MSSLPSVFFIFPCFHFFPEGGEFRSAQVYALPPEELWEYACRAGTPGDYAGNLDEMAWYDRTSEGRTHPVATKKPNAWGFYDMHGNVWEWCSDWYGNSRDARVERGGSWNFSADFCASSYRNWAHMTSRFDALGFRTALVPEE